MKNRLSTLLVVLLTFCMITCKKCDPETAAPSAEGTWKVISVTSSLGATAVQPKFGQAVGGTLVLTATTYAFATAAPAPTPGGSGSSVITVGSGTDGTIVLDGKVSFAYTNLTGTTMTLSGDVTAGATPPKSTQNVHTITLTR